MHDEGHNVTAAGSSYQLKVLQSDYQVILEKL